MRAKVWGTSYYVLAGGLAILFLFPLIWTGYASVAPAGATRQQEGFGLGNYAGLLDYDSGLTQYLWNSAYVSVLTVAFTLALAIVGGYAFARFKFWGRDALFLVTIAILMVPYSTLLIPLYSMLGDLGLRNTLFGLSLVLTLYQLPFAIFMMRISFESVPKEIEESAMVDGCGSFGVLTRIMLFAVWPGLITVGLFSFLAAWNDFIAPLILVSEADKAVLPVAIANLRQQAQGSVDFGATQAGVVVMALPCLLLFIALQRHYVRGFMSGAIKG
ncbi:carbohydrate ABC transporter permease [Glycomyces buryatensis]|uniref:Carbohydrate ABC transporter permease n=1 Tax=Glycomyces buryatensis TaxID=2570927 RepID=A0A4S8Q9G5_9ACTN|nr:carbohydrate ABC transporter permease [Glycomyces buryatensis]THV36984.1 carbohydrate ABC transporter permease [Glycomyces buryatensis]